MGTNNNSQPCVAEIKVSNGKVTITNGKEEINVSGQDGCVVVIVGGDYKVDDQSQQPEPSQPQPSDPTPAPSTSIGEDIRINLRIMNYTTKAVTLNGELRFVLVNPDREGKYHGWDGVYNRTDRICFSSKAVTIQPGDNLSFANIQCPGLGGRSLLPGDRMKETSYKTNVLLYDTNGDSDKIVPKNMSSSFYFENGGTYQIII